MKLPVIAVAALIRSALGLLFIYNGYNGSWAGDVLSVWARTASVLLGAYIVLSSVAWCLDFARAHRAAIGRR